MDENVKQEIELNKEENMGRLAFNYDSNNIIGHVESIKENNDGLAVTVLRTETKDNNEIVELTQEEIDVVLRVAEKCGCDTDGDILNFYVNESKKIVEPYTIAQIQGLGGYDEK